MDFIKSYVCDHFLSFSRENSEMVNAVAVLTTPAAELVELLWIAKEKSDPKTTGAFKSNGARNR